MIKVIWIALLVSSYSEPPFLYAAFATKFECLSYLEEIGSENFLHFHNHAHNYQICLPVMLTPSVLKAFNAQ